MLYMTGADTADQHLERQGRWLFWRPITAIREAGADGNADTEPDAAWLPLINTPPYPDHPSGLSAVSAAMAESMERVFGHRVRFSVNSASRAPRAASAASRRRSTRWSTPASTPASTSARPTTTAPRRRAVARDGLARNFERD